MKILRAVPGSRSGKPINKMRKHIYPLFLISMIFCFHTVVKSQPVEDLVKQGDLLEKQMKEEEAFSKFKEVIRQQPHHLYALIRCSELASRIGKRQSSEAKQIDYYNAAKIYADRALKENPNDSEANVVMALAYGRLALVGSTKEKVASVREIKTYAERALALNPRNFKAMHILGKWHYEVSDLNPIERAAARLLFGGLPKASFEESVLYYERARAISPGFILNYLELAKAYDKINKRAKALELLRYMLKLPNTTSEDDVIKEEARSLLKSWT